VSRDPAQDPGLELSPKDTEQGGNDRPVEEEHRALERVEALVDEIEPSFHVGTKLPKLAFDPAKPLIHLLESFVHLLESFVHLLESFVHLLESLVDLLEPAVDLFEPSVYVAELLVYELEAVVDAEEAVVDLPLQRIDSIIA
jgi:hypothetical protein